MAHPAEIENLNLVNTLLTNIAFDGLEVYHPSADEKMQQYFAQLAAKYNLLTSGGSDFHGVEGLLTSGGSDFHGVEGRFPEQLGVFKVDSDKVSIIQTMVK